VVNISEVALCLCDRRVWSFQCVATQRYTSRHVHWRRYLRPILRTGQHLPCASF